MNELAKIEPATTDLADPPAESGSVALMRLIERAAVSPDFDVDKLQKLLDVKEQWERTEARKAFVVALNAFKADPPTISKNESVSFGNTAYNHATLDNVSDTVGAALATHGLSHTWKVHQDDNTMVKVTCVLTHTLGHSEETSLQAMPDNSGSKNPIQAIGSTVSYLERYTLLAATGLATVEMDDDAVSGGSAPIDETQKERLVELLRETEADVVKFLKFIGAKTVDEIPASKFDTAVSALEKKRGAK